METEICKLCGFWLEDNDNDFIPSHEEAVRRESGYCVLQDLFTDKKPDDQCDCGGFCHE